GELDAAGLRRAFYADTWWGIAAVLWIGTGLARAFGGFEKGSVYYLHNHAFWAKLTLLAAILILDVGPMIGLIQWRRRGARREGPMYIAKYFSPVRSAGPFRPRRGRGELWCCAAGSSRGAGCTGRLRGRRSDACSWPPASASRCSSRWTATLIPPATRYTAC